MRSYLPVEYCQPVRQCGGQDAPVPSGQHEIALNGLNTGRVVIQNDYRSPAFQPFSRSIC